MSVRWLALVLAACLLPAELCAGQGGGPLQQNLFLAGQHGVRSYRIPAMVQGLKGTLIAIVDARFDNDHDLPGHLALAMRRSFDNGNTWTPMSLVQTVEQGGVGDASLLLDRRTGRIWCMFAYGPPGIGFTTAGPGERTGVHTLQIHAIHSDDEGATWSGAVDLTPQIKEPEWQAVFAASGTSIQTSTGRLIVPIVVRDSRGIIHASNIFSDDGGVSWQHGAFIGDGTDESHPLELRNGDILQNMRSGPARAVAVSHDGGATFRSVTHDPVLLDPGCNAGITRYRHAGVDGVLFTNAASLSRSNLTVRLSRDDAATWSSSRVLHAGPAAYSTVIALNNGDIAVLYENGDKAPAERITFARFPLEWLTSAAPAP